MSWRVPQNWQWMASSTKKHKKLENGPGGSQTLNEMCFNSWAEFKDNATPIGQQVQLLFFKEVDI